MRLARFAVSVCLSIPALVSVAFPAAPAPQQQFDPRTGRACGGYNMAPCPAANINVPPGATGEQIYQMAAQAEANHQPKNVVLAYIQKSAELGYVRAQAALGEDYLNGKGVPKDLQKSLHWLSLAADQHSRAAQDLMGEFYAAGEVVPKDEAKAVQFYTLSAAQHYGPAEMDLGLAYEFGRGVTHNRTQAIEYLKRAAADGNDQLAANYANALSRAPVSTHFATEAQIAAFMNPPSNAAKEPQGCKAMSDFALPDNAGLFCRKNPGCYFHVRALNSEYTKDPGWWYQCSTTITGGYYKVQ
jgi:TPR repeat protein